MRKFSYFLPCAGFQRVKPISLDLEIERLLTLVEYIRENHEITFRCSEIYNTEIDTGIQLVEVLWGGEFFSRDQRIALQNILDRSSESKHPDDEMYELAMDSNNEHVYGMLLLNSQLKTYGIYSVNTIDEWLMFHRNSYGTIPGTEDEFFEACQKYFNFIKFHNHIPKTLGTLESGIHGFSKSIIKSLSFLNDEFNNYFEPNNVSVSYKKCTAALGFEISAEGNINRKDDLSFDFDGTSVYCEPHIKLSNNDIDGDSRFYFNRIYFHPGRSDVFSGKIMVGHIGKHL